MSTMHMHVQYHTYNTIPVLYILNYGDSRILFIFIFFIGHI